jgi:cytochrome oxidase Cu insertion factor (SCO1/SenC/PrrC family)
MGLMAVGVVAGVPGVSLAVPPLAGKPAPEFSVTLMDGRLVSLRDFRGQPVLVNFWASG